MKNKPLIFILTCLSLFSGCENQNTQKDSDTTNQKIDSLIQENRKLSERVSTFENKSDNKVNSEPNSSETKYAFVLFTVMKKEFNSNKWQEDRKLEEELKIVIPDKGYKNNTYWIATEIGTFLQFNEDTKYKFIDKAQENLKRDFIEGQNIVSIQKRECQVFDTYKEASMARSKYITDEQ